MSKERAHLVKYEQRGKDAHGTKKPQKTPNQTKNTKKQLNSYLLMIFQTNVKTVQHPL